MTNMRILIRIVFVIFIANGIDCLGRVCDNCCDCFKNKKEDDKKEEIKGNEEIKEYEEIKDEGNNTAISLVNDAWYNAKENKPILKIFEKEDDNDIFTSTENGDKISIEFDEKDNHKIACLQGSKNKLKLNGGKYAFFEIKTNTDKTVYLYCSDVESSMNKDEVFGIFESTNHKSISVIACDTENVKNMGRMFYECKSLKELDLKIFNTKNVENMGSMFFMCGSLKEINLENFNTENVTDMGGMFSWCSRLTELNLKNFNTENVTDMGFMYSNCSSLKEINLENFNTENVTDMGGMFSWCSSLTELNLKNFNTKNVTNMGNMFFDCSNLKKLKIGDNFNTKNNLNVENMFYNCDNLPEEIRNNLNDVEGIINFFKGKNK